MPYTPPAGSAVTFNFTGAYTPPLGGSVVLNFKPPGPVITADPATYVLAGAAASLRYGRKLSSASSLIVNGTFSTDTSPWIVVGADTTFTAVGGEGVLTLGPGASGGFVYQAVSVVPGAHYRLRGLLDPNASAHAGMQVGTSIGGAQLGFKERTYPHSGTEVVRFNAPLSGVIYVSLYTSAALSCSASFDDILLRGPAPADPSNDSGAYVLTGSDATITKSSRSIAADGGTYASIGLAATLRVDRRISLDPGVYSRPGAPVQLHVGRHVAADAGSYVIAGSDASITHIVGRYVHAERGVYALVGSDARLLVSHKMSAASGSYALAGTDVSWVYRRMIKAAAGAYATIGAVARLLTGYRLKAAPGAYELTGTDLDLINRRLTADSGSYAIAGDNARLLVGKRLQAAPGAFTIIGASTSLLCSRHLIAASGSYIIDAASVAIHVGRLVRALSGAYLINGAAARVSRGITIHAAPGSYALSGTVVAARIARRMSAESRAFHLSWPDVALVPTWRVRGPRAIAVGFAASRYLSVPPQNRRVAAEPPQVRRVAVEPAPRRYAAVEPRDKEPMGGSMLKWPEKDPNEVLDYELDWADPDEPRLEVGETLLTSVWSVLEGDVVISVANPSTFTPQGLATVWLTGGTPGTKCILLNRVTTSTVPRSYDKEVVLRVRDH